MPKFDPSKLSKGLDKAGGVLGKAEEVGQRAGLGMQAAEAISAGLVQDKSFEERSELAQKGVSSAIQSVAKPASTYIGLAVGTFAPQLINAGLSAAGQNTMDFGSKTGDLGQTIGGGIGSAVEAFAQPIGMVAAPFGGIALEGGAKLNSMVSELLGHVPELPVVGKLENIDLAEKAASVFGVGTAVTGATTAVTSVGKEMTSVVKQGVDQHEEQQKCFTPGLNAILKGSSSQAKDARPDQKAESTPSKPKL